MRVRVTTSTGDYIVAVTGWAIGKAGELDLFLDLFRADVHGEDQVFCTVAPRKWNKIEEIEEDEN